MPLIPETGSYLLLGLGAIVVVMGALIGSIVIRYRNLEQDVKLLQEMAKDEKK